MQEVMSDVTLCPEICDDLQQKTLPTLMQNQDNYEI